MQPHCPPLSSEDLLLLDEQPTRHVHLLSSRIRKSSGQSQARILPVFRRYGPPLGKVQYPRERGRELALVWAVPNDLYRDCSPWNTTWLAHGRVNRCNRRVSGGFGRFQSQDPTHFPSMSRAIPDAFGRIKRFPGVLKGIVRLFLAPPRSNLLYP